MNGARLWTGRHGRGPALVLLHGGPGMWDYFDEIARSLDDVVEVHRYDQRGGGRSARVPPYDVDTFVADLEALRAHWGHERWAVAGHSWGAALALAYAATHGERVEALICIDGTGLIRDWHDEYHANAAACRTAPQEMRYQELRSIRKDGGPWTEALDREYCALAWAPDYADRKQAPGLAEQAYRAPGPSYDVNAALNEHWSALLEQGELARRVSDLEIPALIVHGAEDPRPVRLAERLAHSMRNARLEVIEGAGHLPWVERPEETRQVLRAFLAGVDERAPQELNT